MKSPHNLLLDRHRHRSAQLDRIRGQVLAREFPAARPSVLDSIRAWITPHRLIWGSFAAAWVLIISLNLAANMNDFSPDATASRADSSEVLEGVRQYHVRLASLLRDADSVDVAEEPDAPVGIEGVRPRSDVQRPDQNARWQEHRFA